MPNIFIKHTRQRLVGATRVIAAYATANPPVLIFPCKDVYRIQDVVVNITGGALPGIIAKVTAKTRAAAGFVGYQAFQVRLYKQRIVATGAAGGGAAVTAAVGPPSVLEAVGGPLNDLGTSSLPQEIPDGGIALTITGLAIGYT